MATLIERISNAMSRIGLEVKNLRGELPRSGVIVGSSGTITATAGRVILIWVGGAWGNSTTAATLTLSYNGASVMTQGAKQAAAADRVGLSLLGRVTAVASATVSVTTTGGTFYNPVILWMEVTR